MRGMNGRIDTYVDTCFLMDAAGRSYVLNNRLRVKVIHAVQRELARHGANPEAIKAQAVIMSNPEWFEKLTAERGEEKERRLYHQEKDAPADRIFRTMAIRCQDFGKKMCLLTADSALADALSVYEGVSIMFIDRYNKSRVVQEWLAYKSERVKQAQLGLSSFLAEKDIVLSSSGLQSAGLRQFLQNIAALGAEQQHLPILHEETIRIVQHNMHLEKEVRDLLASGKVIRHKKMREQSGTAFYCTEAALMEDIYFSRKEGRGVCILVSGEDELVRRYDARTRGAEPGADAICFYVLNSYGEPTPLLKAWFLLREEDTDSPAEIAPPEHKPLSPALPDDKAAPGKPASLSMEEVAKLAHTFNQKVGARVRQGDADSIADELRSLCPEQADIMFVLGILSARRQNKPSMVSELIQASKAIHPYCMENWFMAGNGAPKAATMVKNDAYFKLTKQIINRSQNLSPCKGVVQRLKQLRQSAPENVEVLLRQVQAKGAK